VTLALPRKILPLLLILLSLAASALARTPVAAPVLRAGAEQAVLDWLEPLAQDAPIAPGWLLRDVALDPHQVRLRAETADGKTETWLTLGAAAGAERQGTERADVALRCAADTPRDLCAAVARMVNGKHSKPFPWQPATRAVAPGWSGLKASPATAAARATLLLAWLLLAGVTALILRKRQLAQRGPPWLPIALAALTLLGLGVRVWLAPRTFLHELYHIRETTSFLFGPSEFANGETLPSLAVAVDLLTGGAEQALFWTNLTLATLTIPAATLCDLALFSRPARALVSGLLVALLPLHIRFSGSEDLWIAGVLLALCSIALWLDWLKHREQLALLGAVLATALAMQARPELLPLPLAHALLALCVLPPALWLPLLRDRRVYTALIGLAALCWHVPFDLQFRADEMPQVTVPASVTLRAQHHLLDPRLSSLALLGLLALGIAWGVRHAPRRYLWLLLASQAWVLLAFSMFAPAGAFVERSQLWPAVLLCLAMGGAVDAIAAHLQPRWVLPALLVVAGTQLDARLPYVTALGTQQQEWQFLVSALPQLPGHGRLLAVADRHALGGFPADLLARRGPDFDVIDVAEASRTGTWPRPGADLLFYQGMFCWFAWQPRAPAPAGMQPACREVRARYRAVPMVSAWLPGPVSSAPEHATMNAKGYEVGFFRLEP